MRLSFFQALGLAGLPLLLAVGEDLEEFLLPLLLRGGHLLLDDHVDVQTAGVLDPGVEFLLHLRPHRLDAFGFGGLPAVLGVHQGANSFFLPLRLRRAHALDDDAFEIDGGYGARHILQQAILFFAPFLAGGVELLLLRLLPAPLGVGDGVERFGLPARLHRGDALANHLLHIDLRYAGHGLLHPKLGVGLPFAARGLEAGCFRLFPFGFGLRQALERVALPLCLRGGQPFLDDCFDFIGRGLGFDGLGFNLAQPFQLCLAQAVGFFGLEGGLRRGQAGGFVGLPLLACRRQLVHQLGAVLDLGVGNLLRGFLLQPRLFRRHADPHRGLDVGRCRAARARAGTARGTLRLPARLCVFQLFRELLAESRFGGDQPLLLLHARFGDRLGDLALCLEHPFGARFGEAALFVGAPFLLGVFDPAALFLFLLLGAEQRLQAGGRALAFESRRRLLIEVQGIFLVQLDVAEAAGLCQGVFQGAELGRLALAVIGLNRREGRLRAFVREQNIELVDGAGVVEPVRVRHQDADGDREAVGIVVYRSDEDDVFGLREFQRPGVVGIALAAGQQGARRQVLDFDDGLGVEVKIDQ